MGALIRDFPWESTPLGPATAWPLPLRTVVRAMLTTNHPVFIFWGEEQLLCFYNDAYSRSLGPEKHPSMLGKPALEAWPEIWHIIGPQIEHVMNGKGATWHENHLVPIDRYGKREEVYWTYSYSPIDDQTASNGVGGVLVLCTETTEQVFTAARYRQAEERWRFWFDQAPGFVCVLSGPNHVFEFANPAYFRLVRSADIVGKPLGEALPWAVEQGFNARLDEVYANGTPFSAYSVQVTIPEGQGKVVEASVDFVYQPIKNDKGEVTGIFVQGSDVTKRWEAEKALKLADQRKDDFIATLAHELRNPLAPIQTGIEVLRLSKNNPSRTDATLGIMQRQLTHLVRLVDDLLDISRISLGKIVLRLETVDMRAAILKAIEASHDALYKDNRKVVIDLPSEALLVSADTVRLVQVIANLLNNAGHHTLATGTIQISAREEDGQAVAVVRDDGIGIEPAMIEKLFGMFVQVHAHGGRGLGIGLALVKRLVELHGGSVAATSAGLGSGSEFSVRLPLAVDRRAPARSVESEPRVDLEGTRILVVDDNKDAADTLKLLLTVLGAEVEVVHDGPSALKLLDEFLPRLILLDLGMPGMNGFEVAERVRQRSFKVRPLLVAVTGWGQDEVRQHVMDAGFDHHLIKPISFLDLEAVLADRRRV